MLLLLQGTLAMSDTVVIGVLTIAAGAVASYVASKTGAAEWKGKVDQKFIGIKEDLDGFAVEQNNQWSEIRKANNGVARLEGEMQHIRRNKAAGHS